MGHHDIKWMIFSVFYILKIQSPSVTGSPMQACMQLLTMQRKLALFNNIHDSLKKVQTGHF